MITQLLKKIEDAARTGQVDEIERLTGILTRAKDVARRKEAALREERTLAELMQSRNGSVAPSFSASPGSIRRGARGGLVVEVTLPKEGRIRIEESTGAETLTALVQRLVGEFGPEVLLKLQGIRTARGPLVSKQPKIDFLNPRRNQVYASHRVPESEHHVITHSSTAEKVEHIHRVFRALGIQPQSYRIETSDN